METNKPPKFIGRTNNQVGTGTDWPSGLRFHDQIVNNRGELVIHEVGVACPNCRTGDIYDLHSKKISCNLCHGDGFIYKNPRQIMGIITGISNNRVLQHFGFAMPGDCIMSISPFLFPGVHDFDKITFTWPLPVDDGEIIIRGVWNQRMPDYYEPNEDHISYEAVDGVACIDEDGVEYIEGTDFRFEGKKIIWSHGPIVNKRYTVKYNANFEWIVYNPETVRVDCNRDLGSRVLLRKKHIAFLQHDESKQPPAVIRSRLGFGETVKV